MRWTFRDRYAWLHALLAQWKDRPACVLVKLVEVDQPEDMGRSGIEFIENLARCAEAGVAMLVKRRGPTPPYGYPAVLYSCNACGWEQTVPASECVDPREAKQLCPMCGEPMRFAGHWPDELPPKEVP